MHSQEMSQSTLKPITKPFNFWSIFLKINLWAFLIFFCLTFLSILTVSGIAYAKFHQFTKAADITSKELIGQLKTGWKKNPLQTNAHKNFLILGVDSLETRGNSQPLTDSMILVSLDLSNGKIALVSLPRDLWSNAYKTRINALYTYGKERYPKSPQKFPEEVIAEMTGVPIHHTLVISMDQVAELIDILDGIEVEVPVGFTDQKFPRTDVDVTQVTDPTLLYETISFATGSAHLNGETALAYVRSRHGNNQQNTDETRSARQQLVIQALMNTILDPQTLTNPELMGQLFKYYQKNFSQTLSLEELVATAKTLFPHKDTISFQSSSLSIYPEDEKGVIEHPPTSLYDGQWIYIIRSENEFKKYTQTQLNVISN